MGLFHTNSVVIRQESEVMTMSCKAKGHKKAEKTETNNQWTGQAAIGNSSDHEEKTEFSNEWVSTNKLATQEHPNKNKKTY